MSAGGIPAPCSRVLTGCLRMLERTDERDVKPSLPGQYVTIKMKMPDGVHEPRQYSLTKADDGRHRQFAVKRVRTPGPTERCPTSSTTP